MKEIKLGFTDTFGAIEEFFTEVLSRKYKIVRDDVDPDYLIFGDKNFGQNNHNYRNPKLVKIFYTGENERPWNYMADYSISFEHDTMGGRNYRLPLYVIYDWDNKRKKIANTSNNLRTKEDLNAPREFCSFVVKNGACEKRNRVFEALKVYKPVASAGPLFNNTGFILPRGDQSVQAKLEFLPKYKFNMCFENASYPGYVTEKLFEALLGKTVPIYWGSPVVDHDFNPKAFINWHDYEDDKKFFERIIELDTFPQAYEDMYLEPMFRDNRLTKYFDLDRFVDWFDKEVYKR